jgi:hypothetical protein
VNYSQIFGLLYAVKKFYIKFDKICVGLHFGLILVFTKHEAALKEVTCLRDATNLVFTILEIANTCVHYGVRGTTYLFALNGMTHSPQNLCSPRLSSYVGLRFWFVEPINTIEFLIPGADFLNIFAKIFGENIGVYLFKLHTASFCKNLIITLVLETNANFLVENRQKSSKIVDNCQK